MAREGVLEKIGSFAVAAWVKAWSGQNRTGKRGKRPDLRYNLTGILHVIMLIGILRPRVRIDF